MRQWYRGAKIPTPCSSSNGWRMFRLGHPRFDHAGRMRGKLVINGTMIQCGLSAYQNAISICPQSLIAQSRACSLQQLASLVGASARRSRRPCCQTSPSAANKVSSSGLLRCLQPTSRRQTAIRRAAAVGGFVLIAHPPSGHPTAAAMRRGFDCIGVALAALVDGANIRQNRQIMQRSQSDVHHESCSMMAPV